MPEFAQFIAFRDKYFTLRRGFSEIFEDIELLDLDLEHSLILMFKVSGQSGVRLKMLMEPLDPAVITTLIDFTLDSTFTAPRSWHEIVPKGIFRVGNNRLVIVNDGESPSDGRVTVSDIVVLYHAKTL